MGEIADNETLLAKVLAYVKGLVTTQQKDVHTTVRIGWAAAAKQAHADGEDKLMAADVFEDEAMEDWKWLISYLLRRLSTAILIVLLVAS